MNSETKHVVKLTDFSKYSLLKDFRMVQKVVENKLASLKKKPGEVSVTIFK